MSPGPDRKALLASLYTFLESVEDEATIAVHLKHGGDLHLTLPGAAPAVRPDTNNCKQDILLVLRATGHRMTTSQILAALDKSDRTWGESTIKGKLAEMVKEQVLTNDQYARPGGYGLPEWSAQSSGGQQNGQASGSTAENI